MLAHEFFRAGWQAGWMGTVEVVPQRVVATTLTPCTYCNYELHEIGRAHV